MASTISYIISIRIWLRSYTPSTTNRWQAIDKSLRMNPTFPQSFSRKQLDHYKLCYQRCNGLDAQSNDLKYSERLLGHGGSDWLEITGLGFSTSETIVPNSNKLDVVMLWQSN